jgi:hypothetical protein
VCGEGSEVNGDADDKADAATNALHWLNPPLSYTFHGGDSRSLILWKLGSGVEIEGASIKQ